MIFYSKIGFRFEQFGPRTSPQNSYNMLLTTSSTLFPLFHGNVVPYLPDSIGLDLSGEKVYPPPSPPNLRHFLIHAISKIDDTKVIGVIVVNIPYYLHSFITNYVIAKNVEMFNSCFLQMKKNCEGKHRFKNISFVKIKISKFIHYSINMCQNH